MVDMRIAVYAGTFDPPTNGHAYIIERAARLFDHLVVAIGQNPDKRGARFPLEERLLMLREMTAAMPTTEVASFSALYLVKFAQSIGAHYIVRGLRDKEDWPAESSLDEFNIGVDPEITTIYIRTPDRLSRISSSFVMGLVGYQGWQEEVKRRVPPAVYERIVRAHPAQ